MPGSSLTTYMAPRLGLLDLKNLYTQARAQRSQPTQRLLLAIRTLVCARRALAI